jgi:hypothetical protein
MRSGQGKRLRVSISEKLSWHPLNRIANLPNGREDEFARWIYVDPRRCPGLRLYHEVHRQLIMNRDDQFEVGDFVAFRRCFNTR